MVAVLLSLWQLHVYHYGNCTFFSGSFGIFSFSVFVLPGSLTVTISFDGAIMTSRVLLAFGTTCVTGTLWKDGSDTENCTWEGTKREEETLEG